MFELCQLKEVLLQCLLVLVGFQQLGFKFLQHCLFRVQAHPEKLWSRSVALSQAHTKSQTTVLGLFVFFFQERIQKYSTNSLINRRYSSMPVHCFSIVNIPWWMCCPLLALDFWCPWPRHRQVGVRGVGVSAWLGFLCGSSQTSHTPDWLAVLLLTTKATYISLGQKLVNDMGSGIHQETKLLVNLKPLESLIFLSSHLHMQHENFKITLLVNFATSWTRIKHPLHIQKPGPSICVRPQHHNHTSSRTGSPGIFMQWSGF